jgi:hypothetical protein
MNSSEQKYGKLILCILMDIIGYATFSIPLLGEFGDIVWAPISAFVFYKTFGGWKGALGGVFNFVEEILPFTDFIPTFTITWVLQDLFKKQPTNVIKIQ